MFGCRSTLPRQSHAQRMRCQACSGLSLQTLRSLEPSTLQTLLTRRLHLLMSWSRVVLTICIASVQRRCRGTAHRSSGTCACVQSLQSRWCKHTSTHRTACLTACRED